MTQNIKSSAPAHAPHTPAHAFDIPEHMAQVWSALVDDTDSAVLVVDPEGVIVFANSMACKHCGKPVGSLNGKSLRDIWEEDFAKERLDLLREAASTGRTITLEGMVKGRWMRSVLRPLPPDSSQKRRVLMVCRVAAPSVLPKAKGETDGVIRARVDDSGELGNLTGREMEILKLIGAGLSTADIAKKLHRSVKTVEWHRVSLGNKLGVTNRVELARIAIAAGLVGLENPIAEHG